MNSANQPSDEAEAAPGDSKSTGSCAFSARAWGVYLAIWILVTLAGLLIQRAQGFDPEYPDPDGWGQRGLWLVEGRGLIDGQGDLSAMRGPVIPVIYAAFAKTFGANFAVLRVVQAIFFGLSTALVAMICQWMFLQWRVTLLAVAMIVLYLPAWPWLCNIYSEPIFTAFQAGFMLWWITTLEKPDSLARWFVLGLLFALTALCRPVIYFFLPFLLVYSLWRCGLSRRMGLAFVCMFLGFAILETPWVVRNYQVLGKLILTTTGSSQVLHMATWYQQPNYMGNIYHDPERFPPAGEGFWDLPQVEQDRRFREMAVKNWEEAPGKVLLLIPKRTMMFFFQMRDTGWLPTWKSIAVSSLLYPTAILGFCFASLQQRKRIVPFVLLIGFTAAFYSMLQAEYRSSHPLQPFIIMLSAFGLWGVWDRLRGRS